MKALKLVEPFRATLPLKAPAAGLPYGQSPKIEWRGGTARVTAHGSFAVAAGVGTALEVSLAQRLPDGRLAVAEVLTTLREPGSVDVNAPPGELWFHGSGPSGWQVEIDLVEVKPHRRAGDSLEERVQALERSRAPEAITSQSVN